MSDTLFQVEASHSIYVNRLASKEVNQLNEFWLKYLRMMQNALQDYDPSIARRELNALIASINEVIAANMSDIGEQLFLDLDEFAEYETQFQVKAIAAATGQSLALPATEQVIAAAIANPIDMGKAGAVNLKPWLNSITEKQKQYISGAIKLGYANGVTTSQIITDIVGSKSQSYSNGALELSRKDTASLARTSINHYATTARHLVYDKNSKVVEGYMWISTLDSRTSKVCISRDKKEYIYGKTKSFQRPPAHPQCRSSTVALIKGKRNLAGQRASKGGEIVNGKLIPDPKPVSSGVDYMNWLKTQPAQFQDDVLGKTKGKIFRNSGISADKFAGLLVNRVGEPLTIKDMAKKDKRIHQYLQDMQ